MFDFFLITNFNKKGTPLPKFSDLPFYGEIHKKEYILRQKNAYICYLERPGTDKNMEKKDSLSLFIYGSVFTNKKYEFF